MEKKADEEKDDKEKDEEKKDDLAPTVGLIELVSSSLNLQWDPKNCEIKRRHF